MRSNRSVLALCVAVELAICAAVSAQYKRGFEANEVPPWFSAAPAGVILTGPLPPGTPPSQDLFYIPEVFTFDYFCYTYAGNPLNVPPHPTGGGSQFVAGTAQGGNAYARAQRDISWGTGLWMAAYDVVVPYPPLVEHNLGSFSVQPHAVWPDPPTSQSMVQVFNWVDAGHPELGWRAPYNRYDADDYEFRWDLPGPSWKNLVFGHWYRFKTLLDFDTHKFYAVTIRNLNTGPSDFLYPTDWYLRGGAAGAPIPTGFRFFSGGSGGGNTVAWDNLCIGKVGDLNCDAEVNFGDIDPFVLALTDPGGYEVQYPACCIGLADCNGDGTVNFDDIDPFVALLGG